MCACRIEQRELVNMDYIGVECMPGKPEAQTDYVEINPITELFWEVVGLALIAANLVFWPAVLVR